MFELLDTPMSYCQCRFASSRIANRDLIKAFQIDYLPLVLVEMHK